jgi:hypothetical protein
VTDVLAEGRGREGYRRNAATHSRPWYFATLVLACPACGAAAGEMCFRSDGVRRRDSSFHLPRYELARRLAGRPLNRAA